MANSWRPQQTATQLTSITTEQYFASIVLNTRELCHCQVKVDFPSTPTDDAEIRVYTTTDRDTVADGSANWDDTTYIDAITLDSGTDPHSISFTISGVYRFRVGVQRSGSTDTITSADLYYRFDAVDAAD